MLTFLLFSSLARSGDGDLEYAVTLALHERMPLTFLTAGAVINDLSDHRSTPEDAWHSGPAIQSGGVHTYCPVRCSALRSVETTSESRGVALTFRYTSPVPESRYFVDRSADGLSCTSRFSSVFPGPRAGRVGQVLVDTVREFCGL